jgi:uncharacterized membrane protein
MNRTPLHPILVHLPIGCWIAALILDLTFMANHNPFVAASSFSCILLGLIGALIAAPVGLMDYAEINPKLIAKKLATTHLVLNLIVIALYAMNLFSRYQQNHGFPTEVSGTQLSLSIISVVILAVSGYVGGLLVFEFGIGLENHDQIEEAKHDFKRAA